MEEQKIENKDIDLTDKRFNIQLKKGDQMYIFSVPDGTPYGTAYDACLEILIALNDMINKATEKVRQQPQDVVEPVVVDQQN